MNTLNQFKNTAIALAFAAGMSVAGTASAGSMAQATLTLNNLLFKNNATGTTLDNSNFNFITFTDQTQLNTLLNGATNSYNNTITNGPPLGQNVICTPSSCAGLSSATPFAAVTPPPAVNGALAASNLTGAPVTGIAGGASAPATAQTGALSELSNTGTANSGSKLTLQTTFAFALASATTVLIDFNTIVHTLAFLSQVGSSNFAQANDSWNVVISTGGTQIFNWTPDGILGTGITGGTEVADSCNMQSQSGLFVVPAGTQSYDCSGREAATVALNGNQAYTLSLTHVSNSQANYVPEPESIMLMGLGLVGLAVVRRRSVRKS